MFTWRILLDMGVRQRVYWSRQADAIRRQRISDIAYGVRIGMAESSDYTKAIDSLELSKTVEESKQQDSEATWNMLYFLGGGKSG